MDSFFKETFYRGEFNPPAGNSDHPTSAYQVYKMQQAQDEAMRATEIEKSKHRLLAEKVLASQVESIEEERRHRISSEKVAVTSEALLSFTVKAQREQAQAMRERDLIDERRNRANAKYAAVGIVAGVVGTIVAIASYLRH